MRRFLRRWSGVDVMDLHSLTWLDALIIAALLGLALQWRLCRYLWKGIWLDESMSLLSALMDDAALTVCYRNMGGRNPGLFEFLLHYFVKITGYELRFARLPSVIFSSLTVYFIYRILRDLRGKVAGIAAGLLYAYQNYSITYAHEIRSYALLGLLTSISIWGFMRWMQSPHERRFMVTALIGTLGAVYTHNFGLWLIITQTLFILLVPSARENLRSHYWLYIGLFLLAYAPQGILAFILFNSGAESWAPRPGWADWSYLTTYFLNGAPYWIYYGQAQARDWLTVSGMALTGLALVRTYMLNKEFEGVLFLVFSGFGVMLMYLLLSQFRSCWLDRYLMPSSIGFLVMIVAVVFSFPLLFRIGLLAGLGLLFTEGAHPYSYLNLSPDRLVNKIQKLNPDRRYPLLIYPPHLVMPILYHYDIKLFRESARYTLDPLEKMIRISEKAGIWATDSYDERRPSWLESVDTVLVISSSNRKSPFFKALEKDFIISDPPLYTAPHVPSLMWAYRKRE